MNIKNKLLAMGLSAALATTGVFVAKHEGLVNRRKNNSVFLVLNN